MNTYTIIFGGRQHVEAETPEEAYNHFWDWVMEQCRHENFGLIVDVKINQKGPVKG